MPPNRHCTSSPSLPLLAPPRAHHAGAGGGHDCHRRGGREDRGAERKFEEAAIAIAVEEELEAALVAAAKPGTRDFKVV